ncbi:MAG: hypothetical protein KY476_12305 [Planctomycetes bacterium]|nr:hypothetical protein [Planctomycetota bacterium]
MDLPTCPSCGQSVLDDDAEDCPFCGASMSAKPAAKSPNASGAASATKASPRTEKPAPAAAGATATRERPQKAARTAAEKQPAKAESDDPFDVDHEAQQKAVPLRAEPSKGRRHKVVCPMCETTGYTARKAAGGLVRCANPKCLVPLFTAPPLAEEIESDEESAEPKPLLTPARLAIATAVVLAIAAVGIWKFVLTGDDPAANGPGPGPIVEMDPAPDNEPEQPQQPEAAPTQRTNPAPAAAAQLSAEEIRQKAFDLMYRASQEGDINRRPLSVRIAAEAYAELGNLEKAREHIDRLKIVVPSNIRYYFIAPLVDIAWASLGAGQRAEADKLLAVSWKLKDSIHQLGQDPWDAAVSLAALAVAFDHDRDASGLLRDRRRDDELEAGRLWTQLRQVRAGRTWDLDRAEQTAPVKPWSDPAAVAVVFEVVSHGRSDAALRWARSRDELSARVDCLAAWAEAVTRQSGDDGSSLEAVRAAVSELPAEARSLVLARLAHRQLALGRTSDAEASIAAVLEGLNGLSPPPPLSLPSTERLEGIKQLAEMIAPQPQDLERPKLAGLAHAEAARVLAGLGRAEDAALNLQKGLDFFAAVGPAKSAIELPSQQVQDRPRTEFMLQQVLALQSRDQASRAYNQYRDLVSRFQNLAAERLELTAAALARAAQAGLAEPVAKLVTKPEGQLDPALLSTDVPWSVVEALRAAGKADEAAALDKLLTDGKHRRPYEPAIRQFTEQLIRDGKVAEAARRITAAKLSRAARDRWILVVTGRLVKAGKTADAMRLLERLTDAELAPVRIEAWELTAGLAASAGRPQPVWEYLTRSSSLPAVEKVSACRGLAVALSSTPAQTASAR